MASKYEYILVHPLATAFLSMYFATLFEKEADTCSGDPLVCYHNNNNR